MAGEVKLDSAREVRDGERFDTEAVDGWLKERVSGLEGAPEVTQYPGGASNWTYRLKYRNHDFVLRRPPAGTKAKSAHDMAREFNIQKALKQAFPYVPEMIAYCGDTGLIGSEFYVMRRIPGIIPRASLGAELDPEATRALCLNVIDTMVALHKVDVAKIGLEKFGKGPGYARRQIEGWSERYGKARTWNVPRFKKVIPWLKANTPDDVAACLIHGDFRFDNIVLDPSDPAKIIGVLDWEMATVGDPLMDLGNSLAYWVQSDDDFIARSTRRQPTHLPGMLKRREVVEHYCGKMGLNPGNWPFYEVYGLFRLAVIAQQIYFRYYHRQTRNPAFKNFWFMVNYLEWRCKKVIKRSGM